MGRNRRRPRQMVMFYSSLGIILLSAVVMHAGVASDVVVIEDWQNQTPGAAGIPAGWQSQDSGRPAKFDLTILTEGKEKILRLKSDDEHSMIGKKVAVNLRETPILEWWWKVVTLPTGADLHKKETCDSGAEIYVVWPRFPEFLRSQIIGYAWDTALSERRAFTSPKTRTVTYVVVRSGEADVGKWIMERRNIWDDYRMIYGQDPVGPSVISISIDTNDTHSKAETQIGRILFKKS